MPSGSTELPPHSAPPLYPNSNVPSTVGGGNLLVILGNSRKRFFTNSLASGEILVRSSSVTNCLIKACGLLRNFCVGYGCSPGRPLVGTGLSSNGNTDVPLSRS